MKTDLQRLVLVLLHGSDALVLRIDARCHARLHHCVTSCRRLKEGKTNLTQSIKTVRRLVSEEQKDD